VFRPDDGDPLSRLWRGLVERGLVVPIMLVGATMLALIGEDERNMGTMLLGGFVFLGAVQFGTRRAR
jgi:hypothetical protein